MLISPAVYFSQKKHINQSNTDSYSLLLAALADGIRTLLADVDLRRRLSVAGSVRARECGGVAAVRAAFGEAVAGLNRRVGRI